MQIKPNRKPELSHTFRVRTDEWREIKCLDPFCSGHLCYLGYSKTFNPNLKLSCCDTCLELNDLTKVLKRSKWKDIFEHHPHRKEVASKALFGIKRQ